MSGQPWTIDAIAHALPHPVTRQKFLTETNLAPVDQLPAILGRWVRFIEQWESGREQSERVREHSAEFGRRPAEFAATVVDMTDQLVEDAQPPHRGAA